MTRTWLGIGLLCALAAASPARAGDKSPEQKGAPPAAKDPIAFVADKSLHHQDGSWSNPNAGDFLRRHDAADGIPVLLTNGDAGTESSCTHSGEAWTCRVGRQSAMSEGLYRYILAKVSPSQADAAQASPAPEERAKKAAASPDAAGLYAGYRGASLPVASHQLAFLKKGDYVDVMVTFEAKMAEGRKEKVTATILQNVRVVDVLKPAKAEAPGAVQLLLNPNEAQYAALSDAQGDIHIVRRAPGDTEMHPMEMASFRKLFR